MTFTIHTGDCLPWLRSLPDRSVDHVITDPPYSEQVHASVRSSGRNHAPDVAEMACRTRRVVDLGFEHLGREQCRDVAAELARITRRWVLVFSDVEIAHWWREELTAAGLRYKRTGAWVRIGGAPQFSGDRPSSGFEAITTAHTKGRSRWNGGGARAMYEHCIAMNRPHDRVGRMHPAQKPESLMLELVDLFTNPGDVICDPFTGSGTTGVAAIRRGRSFMGCEQKPEWADMARDRLEAEVRGSSLKAARAGQVSLFASIEPATSTHQEKQP